MPGHPEQRPTGEPPCPDPERDSAPSGGDGRKHPRAGGPPGLRLRPITDETAQPVSAAAPPGAGTASRWSKRIGANVAAKAQGTAASASSGAGATARRGDEAGRSRASGDRIIPAGRRRLRAVALMTRVQKARLHGYAAHPALRNPPGVPEPSGPRECERDRLRPHPARTLPSSGHLPGAFLPDIPRSRQLRPSGIGLKPTRSQLSLEYNKPGIDMFSL